MKKFTKNFLHGEIGLGQVLRKIGLSVVAVLLAVVAFSQEAQETYHVWAEGDVDACYQYDNEYKVTVSFKDFVKIDTFFLNLEYNSADFEYLSYSVKRSEISKTEVVETTSGKLLFKWDVDWELDADVFKTIEPNDNKTAVIELLFKVRSYIPFYETSPKMVYNSELDWTDGGFWNDVDQVTDILTADDEGNVTSLVVTQQWSDIDIDQTAAVCNSDNVVITVVSPVEDGMMYSWNSDDDFTSNPATNLIAPVDDATVLVENDGCVSYQKRFDVTSPKDVSFTVQDTVFIPCPGGDGDIEIDANFGSEPYMYYIMTAADFAALKYQGNISSYGSDIGVFQVEEGVYYVAVQDANDCVDMTDPSWWEKVVVIDNNDAWEISVTKHINNDCNDGEKGEFELTFNGANPPYVVTYGGVNYNVAEGGTLSDDKLTAGTYSVSVLDSEGCLTTESVKITDPVAMTFAVGHTDASCEAPIGTLWIEPGSITGGTGTYEKWIYSAYPSFPNNISGPFYNINDTVIDIEGGVYYVRIFDDAGCYADYRNDQEDNSVKILTLDFLITIDEPECRGEKATATITLVSGDGSHDLMYVHVTDGDTIYPPSNKFEFYVTGDSESNKFRVWDNTVGCYYEEIITVNQPDSLWAEEIVALTLPPTCHDLTDGNVQVRGHGGTPFINGEGEQYYLYSYDGRAWEASEDINNTFAAGVGVHDIQIQDAKGCIADLEVTVYMTPNLIEEIDNVYLDCNGDVTTMNIDTASWIHEPAHLNQGKREPKLYWSATSGSAAEIVAEGNRFYTNTIPNSTTYTQTEFGAGTYYIAARDEWGCYSNVEAFTVYQPLPLEVIVTPTDAECAEEFGGTITIEAFNSRVFAGHGPESTSRYQYVIIQATTGTIVDGEAVDPHWEILEDDTWMDTQVDWSDFENDDPANDSVMVADAMKGIYFVAVRDYCGAHNGDLDSRLDLITMDTVVIDGVDEILLDTKNGVTIQDIVCHVWDPVEEEYVYDDEEGSIVIDTDYITGGYPPYKFSLDGGITKQASGTFAGLDWGSYMVTISDSLNCPVYEYSFDIDLIPALELALEHVNVSCNGFHDGLLAYRIKGGHYTSSKSKYVSGYQEATNNVANGQWTSASIPDSAWFDVDYPELTGEDTWVASFNRTVEAGTYQIFIRDEEGCITGPYIKVVEEPAVIAANATKVNPHCTDDTGALTNGSIKVAPTGGWSSTADNFMYNVTLKKGNSTVGTATLDSGQVHTFTNLTEANYTVLIKETDSNLPSTPYNKIIDYFTVSEWASLVALWSPHYYNEMWQNADDCTTTESLSLVYLELDYEDAYVVNDVLCYNTASGAIKVEGVTGGSGKYQYKLEGPKDWDDFAGGSYNEQWFPKTPIGGDLYTVTDNYTWDNLVWGHYTLFIRDDKGCEIVKESWEVQNIDTLALETELIENPLCNDSLGIVALHATGGTGAGTYKFALVDVSDTKFPTSAEEAKANLDWSDEMVNSDTFEVGLGIYIGFVMDANGCIQGFATDSEGTPILIHRVEVDNPTEIVATGWSMTEPKCFGDANGYIDVSLVSGGNGGVYTAVLTGTDYDGNDVYEVYSTKLNGTGLGMTGLAASTSKTKNFGAEDKYTVVFYDSEGCPSDEYTYVVTQPEEFMVSLKVDQDALICPGDLAGVFELVVINGGVEFPGTSLNDFEFRWEVYNVDPRVDTDANPIEETAWAFTSKFQGQAGVWYKGFARDYTGCIDDTVVYINAPEEILYTVADVSCFDEATATAKVKVTQGNAGRTHQVMYEQVTGASRDVILYTSAWIDFDSAMETLVTGLSYGEQDTDGGHYYFYVRDNLGCEATSTFITFVPVQNALTADTDVVEGECTSEVTITPIGGTGPYVVTVDGVETDVTSAITMGPGAYVVVVTDAHECVSADVTVTVTANPIVNSVTFTTDLGADAIVSYTDGQGGSVDTTLAIGTHVINYEVGGCPRVLNVTIEDVTPPIAVDMTPKGQLGTDDTTFDLVLILNDNVVKGAGAMKVYKGADVTASFDVTEVTISGKEVSVPVVLDKFSTYFVNVPAGFVTDAVGNPFAGIVDPVTWTFTTNDFATDIEDELENLLKVYPNPFSDRIYIDNADKLTRVVVSNIAGQRVIDIEYPEREVRTPNLVSGVYVVTMFTDSGIAKTERIVKR